MVFCTKITDSWWNIIGNITENYNYVFIYNAWETLFMYADGWDKIAENYQDIIKALQHLRLCTLHYSSNINNYYNYTFLFS